VVAKQTTEIPVFGLMAPVLPGLFIALYASALNGWLTLSMRLAQVSPPSRPLHGLMQVGSLTMLQTRPARSSSEAFLPVAQYSCSPSQRAPQRGQKRASMTGASMAGGQCCGRFPVKQTAKTLVPQGVACRLTCQHCNRSTKSAGCLYHLTHLGKME